MEKQKWSNLINLGGFLAAQPWNLEWVFSHEIYLLF